MADQEKREFRIDRERLEEMMKIRGISIRQLAEDAGMHYNAIVRIKREQSTSFAGLEAICDALDCHPFDLIVAEGYPEPFSAAQASL